MEQALSREAVSGTHHRRTPSLKTGTKSTSSTVVSLFVTNLRLLNLDLLPEWPGITINSFGNQDARTRIRCTEFALFQLFRLYDLATTSDKLQPFYPPLEPLQSINLRAALYRCLNDLKKNGVLGKETALRKTMLDECSGDKFWELCLGFSATVLRKVTLERRSRYGRPVAERMGTAQRVSKEQSDSMLPLAIAHRVLLGKVLEEKQRKKQTFARLYDVLVEKEAELLRRKSQAQEQARSLPKQSDKLDAVEQTLNKAWVGSKELQRVLVDGDTSASSDAVLTEPLDQLANDTHQPVERSMLEDLSYSASKQTQRVRRWQSMHEKLLASKQASAQTNPSADAGKPTQMRFDKHRSLSVRDAPGMTAERPRHGSEANASATRYDEILIAMREELRRNRRLTAPQPPTPIINVPQAPAREPSVQIDTSAGAPDMHQRSLSQTAVPVRPGLGRRASSRSKLYQQPKVESQRQPIPLKSELFSPLKTDRHSLSTSPLSSSSLLASPVEEEPSPKVGPNGVMADEKRPVSQSSEAYLTVDSGVGLGIDHAFPIEQKHAGKRTSDASEEDDIITMPKQPFKVPTLPETKVDVTPKAARPSLAERTRMSMAFRSSEDINGVLPDPPVSASPAKSHSPEALVVDEKQSLDRRTSLLDRTRQSISMAPQTAPPPKKPGHSRTQSSILYPINQFDTPRKPRRSSIGNSEEQSSVNAKRDITPREQLFSPDAEYDSVFKPRPKIAYSPVLSPYAETAAGLPAMDGLEEMGRSSPLVGAGGR